MLALVFTRLRTGSAGRGAVGGTGSGTATQSKYAYFVLRLGHRRLDAAGASPPLGLFLTNVVYNRIPAVVKLSNKGRYAVRALFDIAFYNQGRPTQVKDIAERQGIPPRFLEQIFQDLKRAKMIASKRGPQGGYSLAQQANAISLGDVVRALEGPIALGDDSAGTASARPGKPKAVDSLAVTDAVLSDVSTQVESCLDQVSIADICDKATEMGLRRPGPHRYAYVI